MTCAKDLAKIIVSTCETQGVGGNEIKGWIGQRADLTFTYDPTNPSKITGIVAATGKQLWTVTTSPRGLNSGSDRVTEVGLADRFTHFGAFTVQEFDTLSVENIDTMSDVVYIVESKDKPDAGDGDGVFRLYGAKYGLKPVTDTNRANDAKGARPIELGPLEGETEKWSQYTVLDTDYATTKAMLEALEVPAV